MSGDDGRAFYGRWAGLYDHLARATPGIAGLRADAVAALDLSPGDTVVDLGCGTGANVPFLRDAVGPAGRVVGVDFTRQVLDRARDRHSHDNVEFVRGDVTNLPVEGPADAVFASFLAGMLTEPTDCVAEWADRVRPGGSLALLDASLSDARLAWPANQAVKGLVFASMPEKALAWQTPPWTTVTRRVKLAHAAIRAHATRTTEHSRLLGTVRITAGVID